MDLLILVIALVAAVFIWRFISKNSQKRGKGKAGLLSTIGSVVAFFVSVAILLPIIEPDSYKKSKAETAARVAAEAKAKAENEAAEAAKTPEMRAAEKVAAEEAAFDKEDMKAMAFVMCQGFVKESLKAPSTAEFPMTDFEWLRQPKQTYVIKSHVDAQNSFGAMLRTKWVCKVRYDGGKDETWTLLDMKTSEK